MIEISLKLKILIVFAHNISLILKDAEHSKYVSN